MYFKFIVLMLFCFQAHAQNLGNVIISDETSQEVIPIISVKVFEANRRNVALITKPGSKYDALVIYLKGHVEEDYDVELATQLSGGIGFNIKVKPEDLRLVTRTFHPILEVASRDVLISIPITSPEYQKLYEFICPVEERRALWLLGKIEYKPSECI